jgi:uncharacterized repeat protein (TIGR01451 family)
MRSRTATPICRLAAARTTAERRAACHLARARAASPAAPAAGLAIRRAIARLTALGAARLAGGGAGGAGGAARGAATPVRGARPGAAPPVRVASPRGCAPRGAARRGLAGLPLVIMLLAAQGLAARPGAAAAARPTLKSSYAGFTDVNGNGILDCGEPVELIATFATNNSGTPALTGSLFVPAAGSSGLAFQAGSVHIDPDLTTGCAGTVVSGNNPGDPGARIDFSCAADPIDNNAWTLVVRYRALYESTAGAAFTAAAQASTSDGASYQDAVTVPAGSVCSPGGVPAQIAVAKTARGPATPGSILVYTVTATDQSGVGQGGLQLVEAVPAHTTFSAAGSSPGWVCSPGPAAGSLCRDPVGNLNPNASLSAFFAVTIDATLPAAPVTLANTACVRLGPSVVAGCASLNTPAAGAPVLHLAKSLAAGPPQTAAPGATLTYALAAANTGNQDLADAVLLETVPAVTTFNPAASSPGWVCVPASGVAGAACTLDIGALAAGGGGGGAVSRTFAVVVDNPLPVLPPGYVILNNACLHTAAAGVADGCSSLGIPAAGMPMLQLAKTLRSGSGVPGGALVYDLAVQNTGNEGGRSVVASETVPAHTTFAAAQSSPGWVCNPAGGTAGAACTLAMGALEAGATINALFGVVVDRPLAAGVTAVANTACAVIDPLMERRAGAPPASQPPSCDTITTPTQGHPAITLEKTYGGGPAAAGALLTFQLAAANGGDQDAAGVALTDTVPAHTTFAAGASSPGWTCVPAGGTAGAACSLTVGGLPAGGSAAATFAVRVDSPLPAGVQQIANVACAAAPGLAPACGQASTPPPVSVPAIAAELRDSFVRDLLGTGLAIAGDDLAYTLTVTNSSTAAAVDLVVATPLDPHLVLDVGSVVASAGTVTAGNAAGDAAPVVHVPSLAAGGSLTVTFTATVGALPVGLQVISTQSKLSGGNFPPTVSDDPDTPEPLDPTTTPVGAPRIQAIPTLGTWGLVALVVGLAGTSWRRLRAGNRAAGAAR